MSRAALRSVPTSNCTITIQLFRGCWSWRQAAGEESPVADHGQEPVDLVLEVQEGVEELEELVPVRPQML